MEKMRGIYEKNPQLGDAQQVAQQLVETQDKIELTMREIEEFRVRDRAVRHICTCVYERDMYC